MSIFEFGTIHTEQRTTKPWRNAGHIMEKL